MLSTVNRHAEYKRKGDNRAMKFFPRWDGPFEIINVHQAMSNYTLDLPNAPSAFPTYHASQLKRHMENDNVMFPMCKMDTPGPVVTPDGLKEFHIKWILDSHP